MSKAKDWSPLDDKCTACEGGRATTGFRLPCQVCDGSGYAPTAEGQQLRDFLVRHWDSITRDVNEIPKKS